MTMKKETQDMSKNIELRSKKVRKIIGDEPPALTRWGTVIIAFIFLAILIALSFFPSPYGGESILHHVVGG